MTGDQVAAGYDVDASRGAVGTIYRYIAASGVVDVAEANFNDATKWALAAGTYLTFDTSVTGGATSKSLPLVAGDRVQIASGFGQANLAGNTYVYIGQNGSIDVESTNYADSGKWRLVTSQNNFDTSLSGGQTTKPTALADGDLVKVIASGITYVFVGTPATIDLIATDYTSGANWAALATPVARYDSTATNFQVIAP